MGEKRDAKLFLWTGLFTSIAILSLISIVFELHRFMFIGEFILLVLFGIIAVIGLTAVYNGLNVGFGFLSFMFSLMLLNLLFIYFRIEPIGMAYLLSIISAAIGFVVSVVNLGKEEETLDDFQSSYNEPEDIEPAEEYRGKVPEPIKEDPEPVKAKPIKESKTVKKTFSPGKFLASKTGKFYHAPKCEWAKKIKEKNKAWYNTEAEAEEDGLRPHDCLK